MSSERVRVYGGGEPTISIDELMDGSANIKTVRDGQTIQSVIDSITNASVDNPYEVIVPPGRKAEAYNRAAHIHVVTLPVQKASRGSILVVGNNMSNEMKETADYVCDGTEDQIQLQAGIDAAVSEDCHTTTGAALVLQTIGNFFITEPLHLPGCLTWNGGNLRGGTKVSLANGSNCNMLEYDCVDPEFFLTLQNICFEGNKANQTAGYGIEFLTNSNDVFMNRVWFNACKSGGIKQPWGWGNFYHNIIVEYCGGLGIEIGSNAIITASKIIANCGGIKLTGTAANISSNYLGTVSDNSSALELTATANSNQIQGNTFIIQEGAGTNKDALIISGAQNMINGNILTATSARYQVWIKSGALSNYLANNLVRGAVTANIFNEGGESNYIQNREIHGEYLWLSSNFSLLPNNLQMRSVFYADGNASVNITPGSTFSTKSILEFFNATTAHTFTFDPTGLNYAITPKTTAKFYKSGADWKLRGISGHQTTAASTGAGTIKMGSGNTADSAGFIEIQPGKFVPYFTDATP